MSGGEEPAGLMGADRPAPGCSVHHPFSFAPCAHILPHSLLLLARRNKVGPAGLGGADRPNMWLKFFAKFCEALLNAEFQKSNMLWFKNKYAYAEMM